MQPRVRQDRYRQRAVIGVLLPCNVVVRADGEGVVVDFMDPAVMVDLVGERRVHEIAEDVRARWR